MVYVTHCAHVLKVLPGVLHAAGPAPGLVCMSSEGLELSLRPRGTTCKCIREATLLCVRNALQVNISPKEAGKGMLRSKALR